MKGRHFSSFEKGSGQPMTPIGQIFAQPSLYQVMNTVLTTANPVDVKALKAELANSPFTRLPRFTSLLHRNPKTGQEHWRRSRVIIEDHVKVIEDSQIDDVNDYLADLAVSCPLPTDKPLWEVHLLPSHNRTIVFRIHHALADGLSTMSLLESFGSTKSHPAENKRKPTNAINDKKKLSIIWDFFNMIWFTFIYAIELIMRLLVKDDETMLTGGDGVELWPRKLATASFFIEDMKSVKTSLFPNPTINDVMLGIVSMGLSNYMHLSSHDAAVTEGTRISAFTMANLRSTSGIPDIMDLVNGDLETGWGNKIGFMLHPIHIRNPSKSDPIQHLKEAQAAMNKKKKYKVAHLSHIFLNMARILVSPKFAAWLFYRVACNTTFLFSNTMGPLREIYMAGNLVTSIKASASASPQAVTIHAVSYVGKVEMQILVAKDIIPDPDVLAKCFEEALQTLKKATTVINR